MNLETLASRIGQFTVPNADDGEMFLETARLELIRESLAASAYHPLADLPLSKIYKHAEFRGSRPLILLSCHIDSIYKTYHTSRCGGELLGNYDNSACNALLVEAMLHNLLPPQALVAFTGDEEDEGRGADQTIGILRQENLFARVEMVIVLDLTEEHYRSHSHTIENIFVRKDRSGSLLKFASKRDLEHYLSASVASPAFVNHAAPDEAWQYHKHDLNCFSLCLPCRVLGADMHDDPGVAITEDSILAYVQTLARLTESVARDLKDRQI